MRNYSGRQALWKDRDAAMCPVGGRRRESTGPRDMRDGMIREKNWTGGTAKREKGERRRNNAMHAKKQDYRRLEQTAQALR